ncbi:TlpA family protein disulfide reductase [Maribacter algarum]|uniref:TlpA family protein disulfide reductase n=1 Tax=Maribacter algarum (ex Zhang et al. 2020) TaxID=2578118 RepID=A0A5S3PQC5_9FLAO|nr:TlpA disulfide reductase family protein [Maribacter algarum]TMM56950.1 TlpA family protein disulfide reductase [Maribacter algarum]
MKKIIGLFLLLLLMSSCAEKKEDSLAEGIWLAELTAMDDVILPFNFKLMKSANGKLQMEIYNAEEVITVDEIETKNDSIWIKFQVFEGYIAGTFTENSINGEFIKESLDRIVPFKATHGITERFKNSRTPEENVSGIWETEFGKGTPDKYKAKGIFVQKGDKITGTYRTETGDYRYLDGVVSGDSLKISAFDGAHAFVFTAKVTDSSMNGAFYSGNHSKELFTAKRNEAFELTAADSLTFIKDGYEKFAFSFPDADGKMISLEDERFNDKVVIVQVMGTWCPNCLDETKYYIDYLKKNPDTDLEVIAIAFEYAKSKEGAFRSIKRMKDRIGVEYPIVLAQFGSSDKALAQEKLPMLNHVLSYPTSIFIDKNGNVRKIHTGFNGPATGEKFIEFQKEFDGFVKKLLSE